MKIKGHFEFDPQLFEDGAAMGGDDGGDSKGSGVDSYEQPDNDLRDDPDLEPDGLDQEDEDPEADFDELIHGKYKDQYQKRVNSAINKRLKGSSKDAETGKKIMSAVAMRYGIKDSDPEAILNAIENDKNLLDDAAAKAGLTPTQYKRMMELEQEKTARERQDEQSRKEQLREQFSRQLNRQIAECKKLFPGFDIEKEFANEEFSNLLKAGIDVTKAYKTVHMDELMSGGMKMAMQKGTERVAAAVRSNARRAEEGGSGSSPAVNISRDYTKMTDDEFRKFREKVKNGEA